MCSNAINKALLTLPVIKSVEPDIKSSSFKISLNPGVAFSFDDMKKKVEVMPIGLVKSMLVEKGVLKHMKTSLPDSMIRSMLHDYLSLHTMD